MDRPSVKSKFRASVQKAAAASGFERTRRLSGWKSGDTARVVAGLGGDHRGALPRRYGGFERVDEPRFNVWEFFKAFLYESLPPGLDLLAATACEGSPAAAWHLTGHRQLRFAPSYVGTYASLVSITFGHVGLNVLWLLVDYHYFASPAVRRQVDICEIAVLNALLLARNAVVAIKYAYFEEDDLADMRKAPPAWTLDRTIRLLMTQGGLAPLAFKGLLQSFLTEAMALADVELRAIDVSLAPEAAEALVSVVADSGGAEFTAFSATNLDAAPPVSAAAVLWAILARHYATALGRSSWLFLVGSVLSLVFLPAVMRLAYGEAPFGREPGVKFVLYGFLVLVGGPTGALATMMFPLVAAHDFRRRAVVLETLGDLFDSPGLPVSALVSAKASRYSVAPARTERIFIDLHEPRNVFAYAMCRAVLRKVAMTYHLRVQAYVQIYMVSSLVALGGLNVLLWAPVRHRALAAGLAALVAVQSGASVLITMTEAKRINDLVPIHRARCQRERIAVERELSAGVADPARAARLEHARRLLRTADETMRFDEVETEPATLLGATASFAAVGSVLSAILGLLAFAFEGYNNSSEKGWAYRENGLFSKSD